MIKDAHLNKELVFKYFVKEYSQSAYTLKAFLRNAKKNCLVNVHFSVGTIQHFYTSESELSKYKGSSIFDPYVG